MNRILHITNGDSAVGLMKQAGIEGEILPWRDVLHDGPIPADLPLDELSGVRAQFIADQGWGAYTDVREGFRQRDDTLKSFRDFERIILWFEHDLYDQLQLIQILDWFRDQELGSTQLSMICTEQYLGEADVEQIRLLTQQEMAINDSQLTLAEWAWQTLRASSPEGWNNLFTDDTSALPFLKNALIRLGMEFPDHRTGLSFTEYQILDIMARGESRPGRIFQRYHALEDPRFMGDLSFFSRLKGLMAEPDPLIYTEDGMELSWPPTPDQRLHLTPQGKRVYGGHVDNAQIRPIDRWIGGVHITNSNLWRWDSQRQRVIK